MIIAKHFQYLITKTKYLLENEGRITGDILGARWSGKTKSVLILIGTLLAINNSIEYKNKRIRINWLRLEVAPANENFEEFLDTLIDLGIYHKVYINRKNRLVKYKNVEVRFIGYESSKNKDVKKLGIKRSADVDLQIRVYEEVFEYASKRDISRLNQALGGAKSILTLNLSNPWDESHWWLESISKKIRENKFKFSEELMKTQGYNFFNFKNGDFIDWTNHRVNEYLSNSEHQELIEVWDYDPVQAKIVELGLMGVVEGGIYTQSINRTNLYIPSSYKPFRYVVGVDVGTTRDATAFYLVSYNKDMTEWAVHDEYYHSNGENIFVVSGREKRYLPKSVLDYSNDIIDKVSHWSALVGQRLDVEVDYTSNIYQIIREYSQIKSVSDIVNAKPCVKVPISLRIDMINMLMNRQAFHINSKKVIMLIREFKAAKYPPKSDEKFYNKKTSYDIMRMDGKDHSINAVEYAIGNKFYAIRDLPLSKIYLRKYLND